MSHRQTSPQTGPSHQNQHISFQKPQWAEIKLNVQNEEDSKASRESKENGWDKLLQCSKEFDDDMLRDWGALLDNLLTFIGLFSGVVTSFLLASIVLLQADIGQRAVTLLGQVSQQLSSFHMAQNMINSTLLPVDTAPVFVADEAAVTINVLWVSSLTLSLMAAFWAIAVQQWLRHIPLPRELGARESIRLRQLRREGILVWQLPVIVFLLPLAVQIAVLLFLLGLLRLLQGLDNFVANVFAIIGGTLFVLFLITVPLPLVFPGCPFKSPLLPTLWTTLKVALFPVWALSWITSLFSEYIFWSLISVMEKLRSQGREKGLNSTLTTWYIIYSSYAYTWNKSFLRFITSDANPHVFWRLCERWHMHRKAYSGDKLDFRALSSVPITAPPSSRDAIRPCLGHLQEERQRRKAAMQWICSGLGIWRSEFKGQLSEVFGGRFENFDRLTLIDLRPFMLEALPREWRVQQSNAESSNPGPIKAASTPSASTPPASGAEIVPGLDSDPHNVKMKASEMKILALLFWTTWLQGSREYEDADDTQAYASAHVVPLLRQVRAIAFNTEDGARGIFNRDLPSLWLPVTLLFRYCEGMQRGRPCVTVDLDFMEASIVSRVILKVVQGFSYDNQLSFDRLCTALPGTLAAIATTLMLYSTTFLPINAPANCASTPHAAPGQCAHLPHLPALAPPNSPPSIIEILEAFHNFLSLPGIIQIFEYCQVSRKLKEDTCELVVVDRLAVMSIAMSLDAVSNRGQPGEQYSSQKVSRKLFQLCKQFGDYAEAIPILGKFVVSQVSPSTSVDSMS